MRFQALSGTERVSVNGPARSVVSRPELAHALAPLLLGALISTPVLLQHVALQNQRPWAGVEVLILLWTIIALAAARLTYIVSAGVPSLIDAFFWIFIYSAYAIPGLLQASTGIFPWPTPVRESDLIVTQFVLLTAMASWWAGRALLGRREATRPQRDARGTSLQRLWLVMVAYVVAFPILISQRGGFGALFSSRMDAWSNNQIESAGIASLILAAIRATPVVILAASILYGKVNGFGQVRMLIIVSGLFAAVTSNPISNNRYWLIAAATLLLLTAIQMGAWSRRLLVVTVTYFALFGFPILDYFRRSTAGGLGATGVDAMLTGDYDTMKNTTMGVGFVDGTGFSWGWQIVGIVLFWVPRSLWPGKPLDSGSAVAEYWHMDFTRIAGPLWLEGYQAAGLVGVAVVMAMVSRLLSSVERMRTLTTDHFSTLAANFLVGYVLIIIRGSVLQAMLTLTYVLVLCWILRERRKT